MNAINGLLTIINSKRDFAGNTYYAFRYLDCESGKVVCGKISGGYSNIDVARCYINNDKFTMQSESKINIETQELKIRDYNKEVKGWSYAGCTPHQISDFIKKELAK
jgi:hypothetical protein